MFMGTCEEYFAMARGLNPLGCLELLLTEVKPSVQSGKYPESPGLTLRHASEAGNPTSYHALY
eukprot:5330312-Amphidinium_carterae.1